MAATAIRLEDSLRGRRTKEFDFSQYLRVGDVAEFGIGDVGRKLAVIDNSNCSEEISCLVEELFGRAVVVAPNGKGEIYHYFNEGDELRVVGFGKDGKPRFGYRGGGDVISGEKVEYYILQMQLRDAGMMPKEN